MEEPYILTLDIGTTTIRSYIYNSRAETVGEAFDQVVLHYPSPGFVEIDPDELWKSVVSVAQTSIKNANLTPGQITAMGISTQRSTFVTWSRETGEPFHRLITWKDMRADKLVSQWNHSYTWKLIRAGSYVLYLLSGSKRFRAGSALKFMNTQTTLRLCWALKNIEQLKVASRNNDAMFGTLDSWLIYKLTDRKLHVTDVSSASATGFFDPFTMQWATWAMTLFGIQAESLPVVVDTAGTHFTSISPKIWGHPIPILSCMADQTASMWGSCCFDVGDVKLTMGTGTFFNINTGTTPHASVSGLYPVVGWRLGTELVYSAEGANSDTASIIKWAQDLGLYENPQDTAEIAMSVPDSDGVYFIPAFSGLGKKCMKVLTINNRNEFYDFILYENDTKVTIIAPPYNDGSAASGFVGVHPSTTKPHMVRAVLEALAFRTAQLYQCVQNETSFTFNSIRLDGGVSNNDFVAQLIADLTGLRVERAVHVEMSSLGCALIVGLQLGIWKSKEELKSLRKIGRVFHPRPQVKKAYEPIMARWEDAVKRLCGWYNETPPSMNSVSDSNGSYTPQSSIKVSSSFKRNSSYSKIK